MERIVAAVRRTTTGRLGSSGRVVIVAGMAGSARALLVAALERRTGRPVIFVTGSAREAEELQPGVEFFHAALGPGLARSSSSHGGVVALPSSESDPYDGTSPHAEVLEQRALYLYRAAAGGSASPRILITSIRALAERTVPPDVLKSSGLALHAGDEMPIELIVDLLISSGYVRQEPIGSEGEFSSRGGILDVFSAAHEAPHRIEFFGDVVESIREFDVDSQRSTGRVNESIIAPMRELCVRREEFMSWAGVAREKWPDIRFKRDLQSRLGHAGRGEPFPGWEYLLPLTRPLTSSALDYFDDALIVIDEPAGIEKAATDFYDAMESRFARADDAGELALRPAALFLTPDELGGRLAAMDRVELRLLGRTAATIDDQFRIESLTLPDPAGILAGPAGPAAHPNDPSNKSAFGQSDLAELPESGNPDVQSAKVFLFPFSDRTPEVSIISQSAKRYRGRVQEVAFDAASDSKDGRTVLF
ncbi:MAG TPA: hypothetical protein VJX67_15590, partial [Blastocatellia bacterium]|nr:hypothetical protein [Blastocatellia bacterium]